MNLDATIRIHTSLSKQVADIAKPLTTKGMIGFFYTRLYPNGEFSYLSSRLDWSVHYLESLYASCYKPADLQEHLFLDQGISLWELDSPNPIIKEGQDLFGYGNGVTICQGHPNYREIYRYHGKTEDKEINQFYINHIDFLKQFKNYFVSQADELIKKSDKHRFALPKDSILERNSLVVDPENLNQNPILDLYGSESKLTQREQSCLYWLVHGLSSKEICRELSLSHRTVENHIASIKSKLNCNKTSKLVYLALKLGIVNLE